MALKKKPVTGMKDILPKEMAIRDYVIRLIKETYGTFGFTSMETPCVEHRPRSKHFRWEMYGVQTVRREEDTASSCSAISISSASRPTSQRLS